MQSLKELLKKLPWWATTIIILVLVISVILLISKYYLEIGLAVLAGLFIWIVAKGEQGKNLRRSGRRTNETHIYHHSNRGYSSTYRSDPSAVRRKLSALDEEIRQLEGKAASGFSGKQDRYLEDLRRAKQQWDSLEAQL